MRQHWPRLAGQVDVSSSVKVVAKPEENASMDPIKPDIHVNITRGILVFSGHVLSPLRLKMSCLMESMCHTQNFPLKVFYGLIQGVECAAHKITF